MLFRIFIGLHVAVFRFTNGKILSYISGMPILLLSTRGRKSGKTRTTPVTYIRDGENYVITASNNGRDNHPAWFYNLQAESQAGLELPGKKLQVTATVATQAERERLWPELVKQAPFFDRYQKSTDRIIPMVVLKP